jgi:pyridoxine/pyridoxamine 5'-phosphate oxidase
MCKCEQCPSYYRGHRIVLTEREPWRDNDKRWHAEIRGENLCTDEIIADEDYEAHALACTLIDKHLA